MMPASLWRHWSPSTVSDAQTLLSASLLIAIGSCVSAVIGTDPAQLP